MKNIFEKTSFAAMVFLCLMLTCIPVSAEKKGPKIEFKENTFDFGDVSVKKGKVSHEFIFTNGGDKNLIIIDAKADCGCTRPEYSDEPVAPGASGKVKVTFVPKGRGHFSKKVTLTTNGNPRKTRLIIKGNVEP